MFIPLVVSFTRPLRPLGKLCIELTLKFRSLRWRVAHNNGNAADTEKAHTNCFRKLCATFRRR